MLKNIEFFQGLSEAQIEQIENTAERRKYKKGLIILGKDGSTDYLFILLSGTVHAYRDDDSDRKIIVNTIGPGELFGELAMLSGDRRSANIVAVENCEVLLMQREDVMRAIGEFPEFCKNVIQRLAKKVNSLTDDVSCLALMDIYGRIAKILKDNALMEDNDSTTTRRLTHQEIADRVGSSREMVSRILKDLRVGGYISIENKRITILKPLPKGW